MTNHITRNSGDAGCPGDSEDSGPPMQKKAEGLRCVNGDPPRRGRLAARYFPALLGAVSSPLGPLTAVFGMGTGVTAPPKPPARKVSASRDYIVKPCLTRGGVRRCLSFRSMPRMTRFMERRRASPTAYQNASGERVAALAPCTCQPGSLPGAFRGLRLGWRSSGGLGA